MDTTARQAHHEAVPGTATCPGRSLDRIPVRKDKCTVPVSQEPVKRTGQATLAASHSQSVCQLIAERTAENMHGKARQNGDAARPVNARWGIPDRQGLPNTWYVFTPPIVLRT